MTAPMLFKVRVRPAVYKELGKWVAMWVVDCPRQPDGTCQRPVGWLRPGYGATPLEAQQRLYPNKEKTK